MTILSFRDPFRFKSFHRKKSSSENGLQLSVLLKYIYYYQKSNRKKDGPTNFFIFPRERALSPAGLMGDSMMLLHAWHKDQCGSTDQVAWLNPRFFRVF